ncbi:hypothetical protein [Aquibacillus rhizosphaerae]|uniref:Uncharacterized protein n=1 Tax=Aquibacillus rhizosphaerae TaxID=3051431 RepID=A0ABT7L3X7_9BACI|nr:hypothetical protein [Aquibacillus sp. LR5S19]MDL4840567.1 hypothetical protein [Aquibacillus sp. LR5S19]
MKSNELALKRWQTMPSHIRKKLEDNVYCSTCGVTTIVDYYVDFADYAIVLKGNCKSCNHRVARVID